MKKKILIVDDQKINCLILGRLLNDEYDTEYAYNGVEALNVLREHKNEIVAVVLDIIMPVMDGYEMLNEMGRDKELSKIPVIVSSQNDGEEDEIKALSLGAQDFIAKPYKPRIIKQRIRNIIKLRETAALINRTEKDELTGLYNKTFFYEMVADKLKNDDNKQYDILCVGIERFKLFNDVYGMKNGDKILIYIASILKELCGKDSICGRFESDWFYCVVLHKEKYDQTEFEKWGRRLNVYPIDIDIKIHCGIYAIEKDVTSVEVMCDRARMAANKNRGRYDELFYIYDDSLRNEIIEEQFIVGHMKQALADNEFHVYYQPKVDAKTEKIIGAEALVRWIHPDRGIISPGEFIPVFEKNGFITKLDQYVWERACQDIRFWIDNNYVIVPVSVNVSRADLYNPKFIEMILSLVKNYSIPIEYLHLEITESAYTDSPSQIIEVANKLRALGFIIEMDDFGSGYSSLNMLSKLPVNILKLDMGFVRDETENDTGKGIVRFVITLAKWLGLSTVAEGVETKEQFEFLKEAGCDYIQGYYFSKPVPKIDFDKMIV